jgi:superfamily II DNA or RNA helicase
VSLAARTLHNFSSGDIQKGKQYFRQGNVSIIEQDVTSLEALVQGSSRKPYEVMLDWTDAKSDDVFLVSCTCPRFAEMDKCKHVVATILAADAAKIDDLIPGTGRLYLAEDDDGYDSYNNDEEDYDEYGDNEESYYPAPARLQRGGNLKAKSRTKKPSSWQKQLQQVSEDLNYRENSPYRRKSASSYPRQAWFLVNLAECLASGKLTLDFYQRMTKKDGGLSKLKRLRISLDEVEELADAEDRHLIELLIGGRVTDEYSYGYAYHHADYSRCQLAPVMYDMLLPQLCERGRLGWVEDQYGDSEDARPLAWDGGAPWQFRLHLDRDEKKKNWVLSGRLTRDKEIADLSDPVMLLKTGLVIFPDRLAKLDAGDAFSWIAVLRAQGQLVIPFKQQDEMVQQLWQLPATPPLDWPEELRWQEVQPSPRPSIVIESSKRGYPQGLLHGRVSLDYDGKEVPISDSQANLVDKENRRVIRRDLPREQALLAELLAAGFKKPQHSNYYGEDHDVQLQAKFLHKVVPPLMAAGWQVEAEGIRLRTAGNFHLSVTSNVDWFELNADCDFEGVTVGLPKLLAALHKGQNYVELGDGTRGMLPEDWLARYAPLAGLGEANGEAVRFRPSQAMFLDALLAAQPDADVDAAFQRTRAKLRTFDGVRSQHEPKTFCGELREYQREGLGWLNFLQEFDFGGCLADDMGLGKTVQVLALLEQRRTRRLSRGEERRPSLVVVPRSLVHNWIEEAARFTPKLRVLDYTGLGRTNMLADLSQYDLIVTTYGTLRRDILQIKDVPFDYAILDESQAIKNSDSQSAKAVRLISARHRLAMTGTPIENHLGELWSLFEFLNPGMLGRSETFKAFSGNGRAPASETVGLLARALRPYILRRTKEKVLKELPEKMEQTLYCELEAPQRKLYDELRKHYRDALTHRIEKQGLAKSKIQVLEALLRLRQAACHPGLLDKKQLKNSSAKLDTLLEQIHEVLAEGHKALIFSQFTSLLAIVRDQLDSQKIPYEYLDGRTRDRKAKVDHFQQDDDCKLFLISLKAGGVGLNLTAADYVFILDPWWNPAVESQAIDRAHRIGQTRRVFAYRLIARDTVEEKILELQKDKRQLAEAIVSADNSLIRKLTTEDLQLLLS